MRRAVHSMLLCAALAAPGAAWAQASNPAPQTPATPDQRAIRLKQLCQDTYAHTVAQLAFLQARLNLNKQQQPAFGHWQEVKLTNAQHDETDCLTRQLTPRAGGQPNPAELLARQARNLKRRIADLEAEGPALGALYAVLNDDQKAQLRRSGAVRANPPGPNGQQGNGVNRNRAFDNTQPAPQTQPSPPPSSQPGAAPTAAPTSGGTSFR